MILSHKVGIGCLGTVDIIVSKLSELGIQCQYVESTPVDRVIEISVDDSTDPNELFALGTYIGQIETMKLTGNL